MGGYGSGRYGGRPTADASRRIYLAWMLRKGLARNGVQVSGSLNWNCGGRPSGSISYTAWMNEPGEERLELRCTRGSGRDAENVRQTIHLCHTVPNYGGKRWWMICPYRGRRVGKLYLPPSGDRFASKAAWRLGYQSQRDASRDRPFEKLFRLQKKLGCEQGWGGIIQRPKGMWNRTFDQHWERFLELDQECAIEMAGMVRRLSR